MSIFRSNVLIKDHPIEDIQEGIKLMQLRAVWIILTYPSNLCQTAN